MLSGLFAQLHDTLEDIPGQILVPYYHVFTRHDLYPGSLALGAKTIGDVMTFPEDVL